MLLSATTVSTSSWAGLAVVSLLDVFGEICAHILHNLARKVLLLFLRSYQLLIKCILFLSDRVDPIEVVHVADGTRATACHLKVEIGLLHGRIQSYNLLSDVATMVT